MVYSLAYHCLGPHRRFLRCVGMDIISTITLPYRLCSELIVYQVVDRVSQNLVERSYSVPYLDNWFTATLLNDSRNSLEWWRAPMVAYSVLTINWESWSLILLQMVVFIGLKLDTHKWWSFQLREHPRSLSFRTQYEKARHYPSWYPSVAYGFHGCHNLHGIICIPVDTGVAVDCEVLVIAEPLHTQGSSGVRPL